MLIGIGLALLAAAVLAAGGQLQSRGVNSAHPSAGPASLAHSAARLLHSRPWLTGTALSGLAILLQTGGLAFAPLVVVQPLGIAALVFSALLTTVATKRLPGRREVAAIVTAVAGVGAFVIVAAGASHQHSISGGQLVTVLVILLGVLLLTVVLLLRRGAHPSPIVFVALGGVFSGFVATLGKTVILRVQEALADHASVFAPAEILTLFCLCGIAVAGGLAIYFVQRAHATNPPTVVVAGLTVIDPAVCVLLGIAVLHETAGAPAWVYLAFAASGGIALAGVLALSRAQEDHVSVHRP